VSERYDAVVIGAGQAGVPLAVAFAKAGRRTAIVEREHVGGTCVNVGCTPTKTLIASGRTAYLARRASDFGVRVPSVAVDMPTVRQRKQGVVDSFRTGNERRLATAGVELIRGGAVYRDPGTIAVGDRVLTTPLSVINTGGRPMRPAIPGLDSVAALDSTSVMELDTIPAHLIVIGGGYVGLEFAQLFRRLGAAVTVIQRGPELLSREDPDVASCVATILREDGITILLKTGIAGISGQDGVTVALSTGTTVTGSHLLVATGRVPNSDAMGLDRAGVATTTHSFVRVNDALATTAAGIYAAGDVTGAPAFTHISYDDYRILKANLIDGGHAVTTGRLVPYVVFTDPQLGRVGMSETEARAAGRDIQVAMLPMTAVARAIETSETRGFLKAVVDRPTGQVLGCAMLGVDGGELMGAMQIAMMGKLPYTALRDGIFAHPTLLESFNNLFASL
jgi:pyruvate/2-oxoglutarate dehydrogenase complex dihydrolipoamide dehydrogenase (E3) component